MRLNTILIGTLCLNLVAAGAVIFAFCVYRPVNLDVMTPSRVAEMESTLQNKPAEEGRAKAIALLVRLNETMLNVSIVVTKVFYLSIGLLILNAAMMTLCISVASRKPPKPPL